MLVAVGAAEGSGALGAGWPDPSSRRWTKDGGWCYTAPHGLRRPDHHRAGQAERQALYPRDADDGIRRTGVSGLRNDSRRDTGGLPCLEAADLRTCLQFAADRERKIVTIPPEYELDVRYTARMAYAERITIEPGEFGSKAYFRGTRVTVIDVLESLGAGMTKEQVLARFPDLEAADIQACLEYAADRERKMVTVPRG